MITARAPLRISFAGGGSDLPAFCVEEPGHVIGVALQAYVHLFVQPKFDGQVRLSYSRTENVAACRDLEHDIARHALDSFGIRSGIEIVSMADVPAGTGLGSSSAYAVALLKALYAYQHGCMDLGHLEAAKRACHIEIERCQHPVGRQDQYLAAFGGLRYLTFDGEDVTVEKVKYRPSTLGDLREQMLLLYLGQTRDAGRILRAQQDGLDARRRGITRRMATIAAEMRAAIEGDAVADFGDRLHEAWMLKRELADGITQPLIDEMYARALAAGATGGKLCGAGGGGFLLLVAPRDKHNAIRVALGGLRELPVKFDLLGAQVWTDKVTVM